MKQKKLMLLGGLRYLIPVIEEAHKLGLYVITCDYLPDNIAHRYSDEYHNVSIVDKDAVLKLARELEIDGIMSFAVDPGVVTAAYVAEQMGLPNVGPYESVCILQDKACFRSFLREHGFNCPWSFSFSSVAEGLKNEALLSYPAIVKPTDAAGSKGVCRVNSFEQLEKAMYIAKENSLAGNIIVEQFIEKEGCSSGSEAFVCNGKVSFISFASQRFDESALNPYAPVGTSWPSTFTKEQELELTREFQRLIHLLGMHTSIYNIESRIGCDGKPYIMEVSPRGGGNRLSEIIELATGARLIENAIRAAMNMDILEMPLCRYDGNWLLYMLHSEREGFFEAIHIASEYEKYVKYYDLWVQPKMPVMAFGGANAAIGCLFLKCDKSEQVDDFFHNAKELVQIELKLIK